jgi:hypothetical protein
LLSPSLLFPFPPLFPLLSFSLSLLPPQTASGNTTTAQYFGPTGDNWNSLHWLDLAEFTTAFALAYDWFYDAWTADQKTAIVWSIINLGLSYGNNVYSDPSGAGADYSWWATVHGNWNCVRSPFLPPFPPSLLY